MAVAGKHRLEGQTNRFTFNVGVRAERYEHFATTGEEIFTFDWEYAPRISVVSDLLGNGKQKVSAYYGRYYDPIRNNLTTFAGPPFYSSTVYWST